MNDHVLSTWLAVLDQLSYYELFGIPVVATDEDVSQAFHRFAEQFHPDAHPTRPNDERSAITRVFKRGAEAYRVLGDQELRAQYDRVLSQGEVRSEQLVDAPLSMVPRAPDAPWAERVANPSLRPFVRRAEELFKGGDPKQARLQLNLAQHIDRENSTLDGLAAELDRAIADKGAAK